ncbi:MAG: winged helix-turn-helix transcriptional regulator [Spirochaetales bacterium]|nr:winged helix-turn-helix transcriptional regulator [Spirochaetales bacterium]
MKDSQKIMLQGARIQSRINSNDKKPRPFGTSQLLYQSEIHFIDAIEPGDGLNASSLSQKLGITNGAVTQIADKLLRKKLIEKYKKENNKKEVYLRLTTEGEIAFENHRLFHKDLNDKMLEYFDSLTKDKMDGIIGLIGVIDKYLPDLCKEKK